DIGGSLKEGTQRSTKDTKATLFPLLFRALCVSFVLFVSCFCFSNLFLLLADHHRDGKAWAGAAHGADIAQIALRALERDSLIITAGSDLGKRCVGHIAPGAAVVRFLNLAGQGGRSAAHRTNLLNSKARTVAVDHVGC